MSITELEGAVLSEIHHRKNATAFQVRRAFLASPATEWSASKGAVYPAVRRLTDRGLIRAERYARAPRTDQLALTDDGIAALEAWSTDVTRALGVGVDPFRLRAGPWIHLDPARKRSCLEAMRERLDGEITSIEAGIAALDDTERPRAEWAAILQRARRDWIERQLADGATFSANETMSEGVSHGG